MGWNGPWPELLDQTVSLILANARRGDGFFVNSLTAQGDVYDARADLYVQAFVLLAFSAAGEALGRIDLFDEAERLARLIHAQWSRRHGGYFEGEIVGGAIRRQNPHMHLLEAYLELSRASGRTYFSDAADRIATLCRDRFLDRETGALLEYFLEDWTPVPGDNGKTVEPGHCFEWAWLFERAAHEGWSDGTHLSDALTAFGRQKGIDSARGIVMNEVLLDGTPRNSNARLWPQAERLKAAIARSRRITDAQEFQEILDAATGLSKYLRMDLPGLWRDKLNTDGRWVEEPAPGSSLYHITCSYAELAKEFRQND